MDYYPSASEQAQERLFIRKKTALNTMLKLGLELPYISGVHSYEQLLANYIVKDITNSETDYLKQGIEVLFKCLKEIQRQPVLTKQLADKEVYNKNKDHIDRFFNTDDHHNISEWIDKNSEVLMQRDLSNKQTTEEVLIREISEFKIRLGRVNVVVDIKNDILQFNDKKKMEQLIIYSKEIIENPYPLVFVDADAFVLFRDLHSIYKDTDNPLADYSFIYRQMAEKDNLINEKFKPEKFRAWVNSEPFYLEVNTKFKTYDRCFTKEKYNLYQYVKSKQ